MWWVQPFRKYWLLSFKAAKMTFNSRKSTFLCVFIATHHSFCFLDVLWKGGGSPDPKDPPLDPPLLLAIIVFHHLASLQTTQLLTDDCFITKSQGSPPKLQKFRGLSPPDNFTGAGAPLAPAAPVCML